MSRPFNVNELKNMYLLCVQPMAPVSSQGLREDLWIGFDSFSGRCHTSSFPLPQFCFLKYTVSWTHQKQPHQILFFRNLWWLLLIVSNISQRAQITATLWIWMCKFPLRQQSSTSWILWQTKHFHKLHISVNKLALMKKVSCTINHFCIYRNNDKVNMSITMQ